MTGEGLSEPFEAYEVDFDQDCISLARDGYARVLRNGDMQECHLRLVQLQGYIVSLCAEEFESVEDVMAGCS